MIVTWLIWTVAVLVADQVTKGIVLRRFIEGETSRLGLWIRLTRVTNRRAGWPQNRWAWLGLYAVGALGTAALLDHGPISQNGAVQASLGSALGGATGHFLDRWRHHGVVDFIDLGFWPVFNLADIAIVVGTAIALLAMS